MVTQNFFESLKTTITTDVRDWSVDKRSAWIYGIVVGWEDPDAPEENAMNELRQQFGWTAEDTARLKWLHQEFKRVGQLYQSEEI